MTNVVSLQTKVSVPDIKIGTDPELFVFNTSNKEFVSAHDLIPGTKAMPFLVQQGAVQVDGVAAEFNTFPASTADEFVTNIATVMSILGGMIKEKNPDLELRAKPTAVFNSEYFFALPAGVRALGCTPDYNAYTGEENDPPHTTEPFRTGSGHIHIGFGSFDPDDDAHFEVCRRLVRQLDCCLYPISLMWDSDDKRRLLYGKIGAFRPKYYGVEYRPLSNAYLSNLHYQRWVFEAAKYASELFFGGVLLYDDEYLGSVADAIHQGVGSDAIDLYDVHDILIGDYGFSSYLYPNKKKVLM